jgi:hypothetical protein
MYSTLPPAARPASVEYIDVYTWDGTSGFVEIDPSGAIYATGSYANRYTSLAGISYPAATAPRTYFSLQNGWFSEQGSFSSGDPAYTVVHGIVYLSGSMANDPSNADQLFAELPLGARPTHTLFLLNYNLSGSVGVLRLGLNGKLYEQGANLNLSNADAFTSLANVNFPVKS